MKVLVACEYSGRVREAFRRLGHEAMSCDFEETEQPGPHHLGDVREILADGWDLLIAHPPCTYLAVSGIHWNHRTPGRAEKTEEALDFVRLLMAAPIPRKVIENPVSVISSRIRKPDQIIQPWQFGHPESKATCLWLDGLRPLRPTSVLPSPASGRWENQTASGQNKLPPSKDRAKIRSRTYQGVAEAMAQQWGGER